MDWVREKTRLATDFPAKLILASASPRRSELLKTAGFDFEILPASIQEHAQENELPEAFVCRIAQEKAEAIWGQLSQPCRQPVLAADTVVVVENRMLGKPASDEEARWMLQLLSGKEHRVLTGLCLLYGVYPHSTVATEPTKDVRVASTLVRFCRLTEAEITDYVASGEPLDKAGAYAIQGRASKYVEWIQGCFFNVVGLPIPLLYQMLKEAHLVQEERPGISSEPSG
ncbi:MAG: septum formation protein Maf [Acidobacteria bacterium]|nr:septum formation protein Maf [Acidobacteriota bacterium]